MVFARVQSRNKGKKIEYITLCLCKMSPNMKASIGSIEDDIVEIRECSQDRRSSSLAQLTTAWKEETGLPKSTLYSDNILEVLNHYNSIFRLQTWTTSYCGCDDWIMLHDHIY